MCCLLLLLSLLFILQMASLPKRARAAGSAAAAAAAAATTATRVELPLPDDWHHHFRDSAERGDGRLAAVAPLAAAQFGRCIAMPNLVPPVTTVAAALEYRERILGAVPPEVVKRGFEPLMTLYLTEETKPEEIDKLKATHGKVVAVKLYPAGATTNSHAGVRSLDKVASVLERMASLAVPLLIHGEVTDPAIDIFDREKVFLERELRPLLAKFPTLRVVLEHVTTKEAVDFVLAAGDNVAATITPQHLLYDRNSIFQGGLRPHMYCLPVLKRGDPHRLALLGALSSPKFFLGTDSAPHERSEKEKDCGCAGCFSALSALELYLEAFEEADAMEHFQAFACENGPRFYGLPPCPSQKRVALERQPRPIPASVPYRKANGAESGIVPLRAGSETKWSFVGLVE